MRFGIKKYVPMLKKKKRRSGPYCSLLYEKLKLKLLMKGYLSCARSIQVWRNFIFFPFLICLLTKTLLKFGDWLLLVALCWVGILREFYVYTYMQHSVIRFVLSRREWSFRLWGWVYPPNDSGHQPLMPGGFQRPLW